VHFMRPDNAVVRPSVSGQGDAERLFRALPGDRFILPMDGGDQDFDLLRLVPKGKLVVLGLISATKSTLENIDDLMSRIDAAARRMDGDDLALSPATGFVAGNDVSESDQRRKLELVAEVATRWWGFAM
jgi:5-methyltetrahydropteroyltriglutamate--homocysteine methyltransferase